jgi:hypothetical protein
MWGAARARRSGSMRVRVACMVQSLTRIAAATADADAAARCPQLDPDMPSPNKPDYKCVCVAAGTDGALQAGRQALRTSAQRCTCACTHGTTHLACACMHPPPCTMHTTLHNTAHHCTPLHTAHCAQGRARLVGGQHQGRGVRRRRGARAVCRHGAGQGHPQVRAGSACACACPCRRAVPTAVAHTAAHRLTQAHIRAQATHAHAHTTPTQVCSAAV